MKKVLLILGIIFVTAGDIHLTYSWDTTSAKYMPLRIGNQWTYSRYTMTAPGPGRDIMRIISTFSSNGHLYYSAQYKVYLNNGNLYSTSMYYYRVDSTSGNLYLYDNQLQIECLKDSLKSSKNDSALSCGNKWYRCDTGTYSIFSQSIKKKEFNWSNYFEGGDGHTFGYNFGKVYEASMAPFNFRTWTLIGCNINGTVYGDTNIVGINQISSEVPKDFSLLQNYPNPFNPITKIKFQIPKPGPAKMTVYNVLGKEVEMVVNQELSPGTYEADFDGSNLPSGVYYYKLEAGTFIETKKMVLIK